MDTNKRKHVILKKGDGNPYDKPFFKKDWKSKEVSQPVKKKKKFIWVDHRMTNATADYDKWMAGCVTIMQKKDVVVTQNQFNEISKYVWKQLYNSGKTIMDAMKYLFEDKLTREV